MQRQGWKDLFEGVGFLAIIASLIFVGLETRNSAQQTVLNTRAMEIAAYQELINNIADLNALSIADPETAEFMTFLDSDFGDAEQLRQFMAVVTIFRHGDIAYFMYEKGAISEARLLSVLGPLPMVNEEGLAFWAQYKGLFVQSYQDFIDQKLEEGYWDRRNQ